MRAALVPVTALAVLALAACASGDEPAREPPTAATSTAAATSATTEPPVTPEPATPEGPTLPPELAARMPPEDEVDGMVEEAKAAYLAHRAAYDAAARTGFSDTDLVDTLFATATGDVLAALEQEASAIAGAGQVVDGHAEVLGMELYSLVVPEEDGSGLGVVLDVCLHIEGDLEESDGTVVHTLDGDPVLVVVSLTDHGGRWMLTTQAVQEGPCPEGLRRP